MSIETQMKEINPIELKWNVVEKREKSRLIKLSGNFGQLWCHSRTKMDNFSFEFIHFCGIQKKLSNLQKRIQIGLNHAKNKISLPAFTNTWKHTLRQILVHFRWILLSWSHVCRLNLYTYLSNSNREKKLHSFEYRFLASPENGEQKLGEQMRQRFFSRRRVPVYNRNRSSST